MYISTGCVLKPNYEHHERNGERYHGDYFVKQARWARRAERGGGHTHFLMQNGGEAVYFRGLWISVMAFQIKAAIVQMCARSYFASWILYFWLLL